MSISDDFLPIVYRDFYDVPRLFFVVRNGITFLFDSSFDEAADEYSGTYRVCRMKEDFVPPAGSWGAFSEEIAEDCGSIPVSDVEFDASRRRAIKSSVLDSYVQAQSHSD